MVLYLFEVFLFDASVVQRRQYHIECDGNTEKRSKQRTLI